MLDVIANGGYRGCSVSEALTTPDEARVAITFDDGTVGQFDHAAPALSARGMTATFYVTTDWIGRPGYMTWDQLRSLKDAGMSVESHTRSHPFLAELDAEELHRELADSKAILDSELDQDTNEISLPGGNGPRRGLRHMIRDAGYRVVAGSRWGRNPDRPDGRTIRRCTLRGDVTEEHARRIVEGDLRLMLRRYPREAVLNGLRAALGPSRYARLRRGVLDTLR